MRHHPNIVGCFAVSFQQEEALLFFNFYPLSVSDLVLNENVSYSLGRSISLALDVTEGMRYLHSFDLLHRDLKLDNLLIDPIGRVGVCDFGLSRAYAQNMTMAVGSSYYIAPEVVLCFQFFVLVLFWCFVERKHNSILPFVGFQSKELLTKS